MKAVKRTIKPKTKVILQNEVKFQIYKLRERIDKFKKYKAVIIDERKPKTKTVNLIKNTKPKK